MKAEPHREAVETQIPPRWRLRGAKPVDDEVHSSTELLERPRHGSRRAAVHELRHEDAARR